MVVNSLIMVIVLTSKVLLFNKSAAEKMYKMEETIGFEKNGME